MSFVKFSIQTAFSRGILILSGIIASIIHARWLGPSGVGIVALVVLAKSFAFRFGNLGFGSSFAYFMARQKKIFKHLYKFLFLISFLLSLFCVITMFTLQDYYISPWKDFSNYNFLLTLLMIPFFFFNNYCQRLISGKLMIKEINIANVLTGIINVVCLVILVIIFNIGIKGAIISLLIAEIVTFFYLLINVYKAVNDFSNLEDNVKGIEDEKEKISLKKLWNYGKWNYLLMFSNFMVDEFPLIVLKNLLKDNIFIGLFSKAKELGRLSRNITIPIAQVLFPYTAKSDEGESKQRTEKICRIYLILMIIGVLLCSVFLKHIILLLYGVKFLNSVNIFYAIAPGIVFWPIGHFLGVHISASGNPKITFFASLCTLILTSFITYFLIINYGLIGAGISMSIINIFQTFFRIIIFIKLFDSRLSDLLIIKREDVYRVIGNR